MCGSRRDISDDVRELSTLLGEVLERQTSGQAFETVESLRKSSISYRQGELDSREELRDLLAVSNPVDLTTVARAFTCYFELINLAEERARVRALQRDRDADTLEDGLAGAIDRLGEKGPEMAQRVLDDTMVEPTFTAHPTEARRKTVKRKLRAIAAILKELDERRLGSDADARLRADLETQVTSLWQTRQLRRERPEPEQEARNVQWYLENTLYDVVGDVYPRLSSLLEAEFGDSVSLPRVFGFRSWAGSDRDGNPYVTPGVTTRTLERQRRLLLDRYEAELTDLGNVLSQDLDRIGVSDGFRDTLDRYRAEFPDVATADAGRYPDEPYRQFVEFVIERLSRVGESAPGAYPGPADFAADLALIATDLRNNGADAIVRTRIAPLQRRVETFGFTFAALDLRDHRQNHTHALSEALDRVGVDYGAMGEAERQAYLTEAILADEHVLDVTDRDGLSDTASRVLERFERLATWQDRFGVAAIDTYCISMTEAPSHVLEVLFLADQVDVVDLPSTANLDVAPLLESEAIFERSEAFLTTLFENEAYAAALEAREGVQELMLGYSDSNKESGYVAANWSLYENQRRLADIAADNDVSLRLFHGKGGSIARGGGPTDQALLSLPPEAVTGPVKYTVQGEAIAEQFANPDIARRTLEQVLGAQFRARTHALTHGPADHPADWDEGVSRIAAAGHTHYRSLIEDDAFLDFFDQATPIGVIENLNLGSRPASRTGERTIDDLRAIPWVFAWTQARCILPGWYGLGTGIDRYLEDGGDIELLQTCYEEWGFFETMIDRAALSLARTDMEIAGMYADLADDEVRSAIFPRVEAEYERAVDHVLTITGRDTLAGRAWLRESMERRNPYVDPLNLIQIELLGRADRSSEEGRALRLSVKGIAAGMKTTG